MYNVAFQQLGFSRVTEKDVHLKGLLVEAAICLGIAVPTAAALGAVWFLSLIIV